MTRPFQGDIKLDVRDSTADWPAFLSNRAPQGAPSLEVHQPLDCTTSEAPHDP